MVGQRHNRRKPRKFSNSGNATTVNFEYISMEELVRRQRQKFERDQEDLENTELLTLQPPFGLVEEALPFETAPGALVRRSEDVWSFQIFPCAPPFRNSHGYPTDVQYPALVDYENTGLGPGQPADHRKLSSGYERPVIDDHPASRAVKFVKRGGRGSRPRGGNPRIASQPSPRSAESFTRQPSQHRLPLPPLLSVPTTQSHEIEPYFKPPRHPYGIGPNYGYYVSSSPVAASERLAAQDPGDFEAKPSHLWDTVIWDATPEPETIKALKETGDISNFAGIAQLNDSGDRNELLVMLPLKSDKGKEVLNALAGDVPSGIQAPGTASRSRSESNASSLLLVPVAPTPPASSPPSLKRQHILPGPISLAGSPPPKAVKQCYHPLASALASIGI